MIGSSVQITIDLDSAPLDEACAFYSALLGYRVIETQQGGTFREARLLESEEVPGVRLRLRNCLPRPPIGVQIGSLRLLTFHVSDPAKFAARVPDPVWVEAPQEGAARITLRDSSGYHVALVRRGEGCACSASSRPGTSSCPDPAAKP